MRSSDVQSEEASRKPIWPTIPSTASLNKELVVLLKACWSPQFEQRPPVKQIRKVTDAVLKMCSFSACFLSKVVESDGFADEVDWWIK
jgi:hypothetical protein